MATMAMMMAMMLVGRGCRDLGGHCGRSRGSGSPSGHIPAHPHSPSCCQVNDMVRSIRDVWVSRNKLAIAGQIEESSSRLATELEGELRRLQAEVRGLGLACRQR